MGIADGEGRRHIIKEITQCITGIVSDAVLDDLSGLHSLVETSLTLATNETTRQVQVTIDYTNYNYYFYSNLIWD